MATSSWATVASRNTNAPNGSQQQQQQQQQRQPPAPTTATNTTSSRSPPRRAPSPNPHHQPNLSSASPEDETVYVLTLLTDKPHHDRMSSLRKTYFPPRINKLAAHLTLFHALPGSKLPSHIIPHIQHVASQTAPFPLRASRPFRLKMGIALSVAKNEGGAKAQEVHRLLQEGWKGEGWMSEQDAGGCRVHYTIMNKVDDEREVERALAEVQGLFKGDEGMVEGLGLWRYERGWWRWERKFAFTGKAEAEGGKGCVPTGITEIDHSGFTAPSASAFGSFGSMTAWDCAPAIYCRAAQRF